MKRANNAMLHQKINVCDLNLSCRIGDEEHLKNWDYKSIIHKDVLKGPGPHNQLKYLEIHGYGGYTMPEWARDPLIFHCLVKLKKSWCTWCDEISCVYFIVILKSLYLHVILKSLHLFNMSFITILCKDMNMEVGRYNKFNPIFSEPRFNGLM